MNLKRTTLASLTALLLLSLSTATACKKAAEPMPAPAPAAGVAVADITLGASLNADKTVAVVASAFKPADTIYASVRTTGSAGSVTLAAKWTYDNAQTVHEESLALAPTGPTVTEFHISKPDGWPVGKYKVEISINGSPAGAREFEVK